MSLLSGFAKGAAGATLGHWKDVREENMQKAQMAFKERMQAKADDRADARMTAGFGHAETMQKSGQDFTANENSKGRTHTEKLQEGDQSFRASESQKGRTHSEGLLTKGQKFTAAENEKSQNRADARTVSSQGHTSSEKELDRKLQREIADAKQRNLTVTQRQELAKDLAAAQAEATGEDAIHIYGQILSQLNGTATSSAPMPGAKKAPDGKWYIQKDGKWNLVE